MAPDTLTGGGGADTFGSGNNLGAVGQGVGRTATTLDSNVAAGQTVTFGNGADRIADFAQGTDKLDVTQGATAPSSLIAVNATQAGSNGTTFVLYGTYVVATGIFTAAAAFNATTAADALVVQGDGTTVLNSAANTGWIVLTGLASALTSSDFV